MRYFRLILFAALLNYVPAFAKPPRIVVERPGAMDSTQIDSSAGQVTLDAASLAYQAKVDSINQATENKIKEAIDRLEKKFKDPKVEDEVGRLIGAYVMEQQLALLDIDIDRAVSLKDTLLLKGLELGLRELLQNSPELREALSGQIQALENKFRESEGDLKH